MTTRIIAADGTRYFPQGTNRRLAARIIAGTAIFFALIIISAAMIGFYRAATTPADHTAAPETINSFNDGWNTGISDIQEMAHRAGEVKASHCLSSTNSPDALYACMTH